MNWLKNNESYWDVLAKDYSNLYDSDWSLLENNHIYKQLEFISKIDNCNILDLGCGAGLGYVLCKKAQPNIHYTGIDISDRMLKSAHFEHQKIKLIQSSMSDLSMIESNTIDVVISIFTAFSFTDDVHLTLSEIIRVLKPGGKFFISVLSKFSLRRICRLKNGKLEKYRTRGSKIEQFSYGWVFSVKELQKVFRSNQFNISEITGYNIFAGFSYLEKKEKFWKANIFFSNVFTNLSHEIIIKGELD